MSMKAAVDEINHAVTAALADAAGAYDQLTEHLKDAQAPGAPAPDPAVVLRLSGQIWESSLKAWARLALAPGKLAAEIATGGD